MIPKGLIDKMFEAASMQRWNDHVRPMELFELDKQAHKMMFAYVIARLDDGNIDWLRLIEAGIFEFLHRVILTDIKPAVYHKMMAEKGRELNEKVIANLTADVEGIAGGFLERFRSYLFDPAFAAPEKRVLKAAHYLASNWEFRIIYRLNREMWGIEQTRAVIERQINDHADLPGLQRLLKDNKLYGFLDLCGQLRFQQRWAQTPRIPKTSVLGHQLVVALLAYFVSCEVGACGRRIYNNFYGALFHDLPEVLTRDIVSPVKDAIAGLDALIKEYETKQLSDEILPLLPMDWHAEIRYFVQNEFSDKIMRGGAVTVVDRIDVAMNRDDANPIDGSVIRVCDKLAAYIEASLSIAYGIKARNLEEGRQKIGAEFSGRSAAGFSFGPLFAYYV
jgi:putative hydrolase of HD superfamily